MSDNSSKNSNGWNPQHFSSFKGISRKRSCTDFYCLVIFGFFITFWLSIGYYAYWNGDVNRLMALKDSYGRTCGLDEDVKDNKYLFFFDITECVSLSFFLFGCSETKQICVAECPTENWFSSEVLKEQPLVNWSHIREKLICENKNIAKSVNSERSLKNVIEKKKCASYYVKSTPPSDFFRVCLPNLLAKDSRREDWPENIKKSDKAQNYFRKIYEVVDSTRKDLLKCWHLIALFIMAAIISCLFTILIMGVITKIFVWVILWSILFLLLCSTVVTYMQYESMSSVTNKANLIPPEDDLNSSVKNVYSWSLYENICWFFQQRQTWLVLSITSAIGFLLFALLLIFLRSRIGIAVMLIGEGSKALNTIKTTLCVPIVSQILKLVVVIWFLLVHIYIESLGNSVYQVQGLRNDTDCQCRNYNENDWCIPHQFNQYCVSRSHGGACESASCVFTEFRSPKLKFYYKLYNFFGLLWSLFFISGFKRMVLSFCFATWYWTYNKADVQFFTLTYSFFITVRYHLGTIAFGSFLIATCGFLRAILERLHKMIKRADAMIADCAMWSMRCCFWLLQKFFIFISDNAYIMCAITGRGFFSSASEAFGLITRNIIRVVVLDKVLDFLLFVGKFVLTFLLTAISFFVFSTKPLGLTYPWVPTVIVALITWLITASFFGVYTAAVDTLFLSFLKDGELNDGSQNKPYYMSHRLKYILKKKLAR